MAYKLLLTGRYTAIIDTFFNHLTQFECITTSTRFEDMKQHVDLFHPDILVICLQSEEIATFKRVTELMNRYTTEKFYVIIIGDDEECAEFQKKTGALADREIHKPLSPSKISKLIEDYLSDHPRPKWNTEEGEQSGNVDAAMNTVDGKPAPKREETEEEKLMRILQSVEEETSVSDISGLSDTSASDPFLSEVLNSVTPQTNIDSLVNGTMHSSDALMPSRQSDIDALIADTANQQPLSPKKKHILVIDDDPLMLKVIKDYLHDDYDIATAKGGKIAYKFLEKKHTDLILLDYEMPEEDGPTVYQNIRALPGMANIPILFLTGVSDKARIMNVISLKPQGYLLKPIEYETLITTITPILNK